MFDNNVRAKLQINKAVVIGFLAALDECNDRRVNEFMELLRGGVEKGLGPLPKPPALKELDVPEDERRRLTDRDVSRAWHESFMTVEHCGDLPGPKDVVDVESCVRVVDVEGNVNHALTELARLAFTSFLKAATMEIVMAKTRAR